MPENCWMTANMQAIASGLRRSGSVKSCLTLVVVAASVSTILPSNRISSISVDTSSVRRYQRIATTPSLSQPRALKPKPKPKRPIGFLESQYWRVTLNDTSAQLGYTVPFTSAHAGKYRTEDKWRTDTRKTNYNPEQESRAAARKPRDAASVLFCWSSPTKFTTSITLAKLRKRPRFRAPNMLTHNAI